MALPVLDQLLERRQAENDGEGHQRDVAASRRDVRDLLQQPDGQEEDVGVSPELLEQKLRQECEEVVLGGGHLVRAELVLLLRVDVDGPSLFNTFGMVADVPVRLRIFVEDVATASDRNGHLLGLFIELQFKTKMSFNTWKRNRETL